MADYYQVKNQNIFTPPANISLGNTSNQYSNVYVQNNLVVGNVTVTSSTIIAPRVTTITYPGNDTAADPAGGQTITLTGSGFVAGASILINSIAVSVVSVVSSTVITFTSPANSSGSYVIYVVNPDGSTAIAVPGIQYSGIPTWTTAAGTLGSLYETASFTQTVTATGDAPITYSVASGTLPPGATFNGNGTITGTSQLTASPTTYTFTVSATDAEQQDTNRSFSLTINTDVVTWTTPAANSTTTLSQNVASTTTLLATSAAGKAITYTANALPTGLSIVGAAVTGTPTVTGNTTSLFTATAATTGRTTTATINWTISVANDLYFMYNSLLLSGQTSTSTFIADASTNNFPLTIAGDTKPNNFNPYTPGYYSNYFDGTGDYLSIANNAALNLGNNSWTCELWIYPTGNYTTYNTLFAKRNSASLCAYEGYLTPTNGYLGYYNGTLYTSTTAPNTGKWNHIAYVFDGTNIKIYLNGTQVLSSATSNADQAVDLYIGMYNSSGTPYDYYFGYISNFRLVKGVAVYTGTFTPPTAPLTATQSSGTNISAITGTQTSLLTCQSNRFIDNSTNAFTITVVGNTTVNPNNPFVPNTAYAAYGSTYFDGTGDYLTSPANTAFAFAKGDLTVQMWIYPTATITTPANIGLFYIEEVNGLVVGLSNGYIAMGRRTIAYDLTSTYIPLVNTWTHIAVTRSSATAWIFANGVQVGTVTASGGDPNNNANYVCTTGLPTIAGNYAGGAGFGYFPGYISDIQVVKGTAVYTSAFTPPAAPLTAIANTSLLTCQTNQPVNNSVFLDSSTNALAVTRAGNTTQGTFSPYGANWSNYFGSANYISAASNAAFGFGTGDFTVEAWVYPNAAYTTYNYIWATGVTTGLVFYVLGGVLYVRTYNGSDLLASSTAPAINAWTHVAATRSGTTLRIFVNGVQTGTTTNSTNFATGSGIVGNDGTNAAPWLGYISNLRVVKGTAVYTSNFTPSTTPLTAIANTSLLTCQSNRFIDNSANAFTITITGDTKVQRFSPFSPSASYSASTTGGSAYFDGTGDYLSVPTATPIVLSGTVWTMECWCYLTSSSFSTYRVVLNKRSGSSAASYDLYFNITTGYLSFYNGTAYNSSVAPIINAWNHIAAVYDGTNINLYMNGVRVLQSATTNPDNGGNLYISADENGTSNFFIGYVSNVRIVKGTAVYTSNFVPPVAPVTVVTNTSLLLNMTSAGVYDSASMNNLETVGDAKISTAQSKFGGSSMLFDGTGDNLNLQNNTVFAFNTGDFTIEAWVYPTATHTGAGMVIFDQRTLYNSSNGINMWLRGSTNVLVFSTNGNQEYAGSLTAPVNTWTHVAVVKTSGVIKSYVNGVLSTTFSYATSLSDTSACIGRSTDTNVSYYFEGYIDDLRVTKGIARYTANFAPPTAAFPTY